MVLVSTDLIGMTDEVCMPAFEQASRKWDIPLISFVACATHTHTGPEVRRGNHVPACEDYLQKVPGLISEAVTGALEDLFDAVVCVGNTRAPGLAYNRLSRCADGSEIFGRQIGDSKVIGAAGTEDDMVQTISVYDTEKRLHAVAVNFACHPDLAGGGSAKAIDSDWPGDVAENLMKIHGSHVACMVLQGTAGDINHGDHRAKTPRWLPGGRSMVARGVTGAALYAMETSTPLGDVNISCRKRELEVPYYVRDETLYNLVQSLREKGDTATYFEKNLIKKVENWKNDGKTDQFSVSCMRIGDLTIVAMPGEIFTAWGLEIKRYSPARHTLVVELASSHDGLTGYKPTSDQALRAARGKGAYGALPVMSQKHCPAAGQMMTEAAIAMLHELWPQ
ncbi:hypothetical protein ACFL6S_04260 [Candidatus Poribacteria bacterium]